MATDYVPPSNIYLAGRTLFQWVYILTTILQVKTKYFIIQLTISVNPVLGPHLCPASGFQVLDEHTCHQGLERSNKKSPQLELSKEPTISLLPSATDGPAGCLLHLQVPSTSSQDILPSLPRFHCHTSPRNVCLLCYLAPIPSWAFPKAILSSR